MCLEPCWSSTLDAPPAAERTLFAASWTKPQTVPLAVLASVAVVLGCLAGYGLSTPSVQTYIASVPVTRIPAPAMPSAVRSRVLPTAGLPRPQRFTGPLEAAKKGRPAGAENPGTIERLRNWIKTLSFEQKVAVGILGQVIPWSAFFFLASFLQSK